MSDSPRSGPPDTFSKMDALMKKHRGGVDAGRGEAAASPPPASGRAGPPPNAWLPVLTQVIERGTPPATSAPAGARPVPTPEPAAPRTQSPPAAAEARAPIASDALAEELLGELAPKLSEAMEKQVAAELRKNIDQTLSGLLSQLDVNVREIVRDAVAEKLKQPRDPST
ncbi:MAG: hypothetical protein M0Z73_06695 [Betaproteobacteria bacterium]|nr:hypothetical protein [Betaproteobacteria bacterium]